MSWMPLSGHDRGRDPQRLARAWAVGGAAAPDRARVPAVADGLPESERVACGTRVQLLKETAAGSREGVTWLSPWEWSSRSEVASQSGSNDDAGDVMLVMEVSMRTTVTLDDDLLARAQELTGIKERSALIRDAVELLVRIESGRQLAALGGSDPGAEAAPRSRARA